MQPKVANYLKTRQLLSGRPKIIVSRSMTRRHSRYVYFVLPPDAQPVAASTAKVPGRRGAAALGCRGFDLGGDGEAWLGA